jgi:hypothetical protein
MAGAQVLQRIETLRTITPVLYYRVRVTFGTGNLPGMTTEARTGHKLGSAGFLLLDSYHFCG